MPNGGNERDSSAKTGRRRVALLAVVGLLAFLVVLVVRWLAPLPELPAG